MLLFALSVTRIVFGELRTQELNSAKDKFWNFVFYKVVLNLSKFTIIFLCSSFLYLVLSMYKRRIKWWPGPPGFQFYRFLSLWPRLVSSGNTWVLFNNFWKITFRYDHLCFSPNTPLLLHFKVLFLLSIVILLSLVISALVSQLSLYFDLCDWSFYEFIAWYLTIYKLNNF